jgi:hypothetical protein
VFKGREGQHLKLQLRSLRLLSVRGHDAARGPQVKTVTPDGDYVTPLMRTISRIVRSATRAAKSDDYLRAAPVIYLWHSYNMSARMAYGEAGTGACRRKYP